MRKRKIEAPARAPRARNGHGRQRQRLIEACISALHIHGPSRTTVEKVVTIAKMSPGIVRFYFDSKAAMLIASLQYLSAEFEERVLVPVSKLRETPVSALELMVDLYLDPDIASPRKVSVWYAFWGEASSRQEYYDICGQKDESFTVLVRELIGRLVRETGQTHLDPDAVALGLIGVLEVLWQDFAFQDEVNINRADARRRAMAYLRSVFPGQFSPTRHSGGAGGGPADTGTVALTGARGVASSRSGEPGAFALERDALFKRAWLIVGHESQLPGPGEFFTTDTGAERVLVVRDGAGGLHALRNSCLERPHTLVTASSGRFVRGIECALHGLAYGLDGRRVERAAGTEGVDRDNLRPLALHAWGGWILASSTPSGDAPPDWEHSGERPPSALRPFGVGFEAEAAADWKLLIEQWLEAAPVDAAAAAPDAGSLLWRIDQAAGAGGWSWLRYRGLLGSAAGAAWQVRFVLPNQLLESRPDGLSIWQAIPIERGRTRLRRFDYGVGAFGDGSRALPYLAGRMGPRGRRAALAVAESVQQAVDRFDYPAASSHPAHPAVAWFRAQVTRGLSAPGASPASTNF